MSKPWLARLAQSANSSRTSNADIAFAKQLVKLHNSDFTFVDFVDAESATPQSYTANNAWIVTETTTIFGIAVTIGQIIYDTGSGYVAENIASSGGSSLIVFADVTADHTTTGDENFISVITAANNITVTLDNLKENIEYKVFKADNGIGTVLINNDESTLIETLRHKDEWINVIFDGTNFRYYY